MLNHVAAMFSHSERNRTTINCTVRFDQRPPEPGKMLIDDKSGVSPREWSLLPAIEGEAVVWFVPELGETHSSMDLADAIVKGLSEHHKRHEQHLRPIRPRKEKTSLHVEVFSSDVEQSRRLFERFCTLDGEYAPHPMFGQLAKAERMRPSNYM
jgi:hypothetical protein